MDISQNTQLKKKYLLGRIEALKNTCEENFVRKMWCFNRNVMCQQPIQETAFLFILTLSL
ncbi:hypothetical protein DC487_01230 [Sphingobacterium corticibacter]|uniref:Uncharacterized protein n=1 Tax=Sphingobacterium corticibacter TaxID=2171749 RepID=A0A2T8HLG9_9SPHI|nr:hypothetical protein DC487_01230 [Sphingobacterium corticibacter]